MQSLRSLGGGFCDTRRDYPKILEAPTYYTSALEMSLSSRPKATILGTDLGRILPQHARTTTRDFFAASSTLKL